MSLASLKNNEVYLEIFYLQTDTSKNVCLIGKLWNLKFTSLLPSLYGLNKFHCITTRINRIADFILPKAPIQLPISYHGNIPAILIGFIEN